MKTKILILGVTGMIGHNLYKEMISKFSSSDIYYLTSKSKRKINYYNFFILDNGYFNIIYFDYEKLKKIILELKPNFIINCCGITKKKCTSLNSFNIKNINVELPKFLSEMSKYLNYKFIHLSSDCVFSGKHGNYKINDDKDPTDLYGISKSNSEYINDSTLVLRKSTIGLELNEKHGLLEWFLSENGILNGYKNAIFSGLTTKELSKIIIFIIREYSQLSGIYHVGSDNINKFDLLLKISNLLKNFKTTFLLSLIMIFTVIDH